MNGSFRELFFKLTSPLRSGLVWVGLVPFAFFSFIGAATHAESEATREQLRSLEQYLAVDRLTFYSDFLADHVLLKHKNEALSEALRALSPEAILSLGYTADELSTTSRWDEILLKALNKERPQLAVRASDLSWNYNFFKNKLGEGFRVLPFKKSAAESGFFVVPDQPQTKMIDGGPHPRVLMDTDRYIAEKTTRAIYWDAASTGKNFEFFMGTERDFRQRIAASGARVVAEVKPHARNYNKIYLIQNRGSENLTYAFTRISGRDRLDHLIRQLRMVGLGGRLAVPDGMIKVHGDPDQVLASQEAELVKILSRLPKADLTIIGQKGAIESAIQVGTRAEDLAAQIGQASADAPASSDSSRAERLLSRVKESFFELVTSGSDVNRLHKRLILQNEGRIGAVVEISQPSHDIADFLLEDANGRRVRWRLISNVWGDEVIPIAKALRRANAGKVVYIGTVGALPGKGLEVGDLVSPTQVLDSRGRVHELNQPTYARDIVKRNHVLGQLTTPYEETEEWLKHNQDKIDLVELETNYLRENLGDRNQLEVYLLVSDVINSNESLASASANHGRRKTAQLKLLRSLFVDNGIRRVVGRQLSVDEDLREKLYERLETIIPSRDEVSKFQIVQKAMADGIDPDGLKTLIENEKPFDRNVLQAALALAGERLSSVATEIFANSPAKVYVYLQEEFLNGSWNPKSGLRILIQRPQVLSPELASSVLRRIEESNSSRSGKTVQLDVVDAPPTVGWQRVELASMESSALFEIYSKVAFDLGGLIAEISVNGSYRFKRLKGPQAEPASALLSECTQAFGGH
jgi:hypothetical protein